MAIVILLLIFCGAMLLLDLMLCGLGALCYGFYFKCVDWFEKI